MQRPPSSGGMPRPTPRTTPRAPPIHGSLMEGQSHRLVLAPLERGQPPENFEWGQPLPAAPPMFSPTFRAAFAEEKAAMERQKKPYMVAEVDEAPALPGSTQRTLTTSKRLRIPSNPNAEHDPPNLVTIPDEEPHGSGGRDPKPRSDPQAAPNSDTPGPPELTKAGSLKNYGAMLRAASRRVIDALGGQKVKGEDLLPPDPATYNKVSVEDIERRLAKSLAYKERHRSENESCAERDMTIDPRGAFSNNWDLVVALLLAYVSFVSPVEISFLGDSTDIAFEVVNRFVDCLFVIDMAINFSMMYLDKNNKWETKWAKCALHYMKGWFVLDIVSIFPFSNVVEWATAGGDASNLKILRIIRLVRLVKLARILRASRLIKRFESKTDMSYSAQSLLKHIATMLVVVHWSGCLWHLAPTLEGEDSPNWVTAVHMDHAEVYDLYITSFMVGVMSLPAGVPALEVAVTSFERGFSIFIMLFAGGAFAYAIGEVSNIVMNMDPATADFQATMDNMNSFIVESKIPPELALSMREYMHTCRSLFRSKFFIRVLELMSPTLRQGVALHVHGAWLLQIPFFKAPNENERLEFCAAVALSLDELVFTPKEMVIYAGEPAKNMYVVKSGLVARLGRVFGAGRFVGEDIILRNSSRKYYVRALTYVNAQRLTRDRLLEILDVGDFPQTRKLIHNAAVRLSLKREMARIADNLRAARILDKKMTRDTIGEMSNAMLPNPSSSHDGVDVRATAANITAAHAGTVHGIEIKAEQVLLRFQNYKQLVQRCRQPQ